MIDQSKRPDVQIERLSVSKLFDRFDHAIDLTSKKQIALLIAPNGFGKTVMLKVMHNFATGNLRFFTTLSFKKIEFKLSDETEVTITKQNQGNESGENDASPTPDLLFEMRTPTSNDFPPYSYGPSDFEELFEYIEKRFPVQRLGPDKWHHGGTDDVVTTDDVLMFYIDAIPTKIARPSNFPEWLEAIIGRISSHFIETQRLLSFSRGEVPRYMQKRRAWKSGAVVERDARDLVRRIELIVSKYAARAQQLDQSFPRRIIEHRNNQLQDETEVRARLTALARKRGELIGAGLIREGEEEHLSNTDDLADEDIRRILSIYISDTETKLNVFDELNSKVKLFTSILNEHFVFKRIEVNQEDGITAVDVGSLNPMRLSELSSGEQHELVLLYALLFVVSEGAVILIDEPELSLHVGWQRRFVADLMRIQELRDLRFVIATHSPQIISDHWDLVQELTHG